MQKGFLKKVLLAVNGSESSIHAAMYAIMLASSYKIDLKALYVVDSATIKNLGRKNILIYEEALQFEQDLITEGNGCLDYIKGLAGAKGLHIETELRSGKVFKEIIKAAKEYETDLIILGGEEKKERDYITSRNVISEHRNEILSLAECPVLVVNEPDIQAEFNSF